MTDCIWVFVGNGQSGLMGLCEVSPLSDGQHHPMKIVLSKGWVLVPSDPYVSVVRPRPMASSIQILSSTKPKPKSLNALHMDWPTNIGPSMMAQWTTQQECHLGIVCNQGSISMAYIRSCCVSGPKVSLLGPGLQQKQHKFFLYFLCNKDKQQCCLSDKDRARYVYLNQVGITFRN